MESKIQDTQHRVLQTVEVATLDMEAKQSEGQRQMQVCARQMEALARQVEAMQRGVSGYVEKDRHGRSKEQQQQQQQLSQLVVECQSLAQSLQQSRQQQDEMATSVKELQEHGGGLRHELSEVKRSYAACNEMYAQIQVLREEQIRMLETLKNVQRDTLDARERERRVETQSANSERSTSVNSTLDRHSKGIDILDAEMREMKRRFTSMVRLWNDKMESSNVAVQVATTPRMANGTSASATATAQHAHSASLPNTHDNVNSAGSGSASGSMDGFRTPVSTAPFAQSRQRSNPLSNSLPFAGAAKSVNGRSRVNRDNQYGNESFLPPSHTNNSSQFDTLDGYR